MTGLHRYQDIFHFLFLAFRVCFRLCHCGSQPSSKRLYACFLAQMLGLLRRAKDDLCSDCSSQSWEPLALMLALWEACVLTSALGLALPTALGSCFLWFSNFVELNARALLSVIIIVTIWCLVKNPFFFLFSYVAQNASINYENTFSHETKVGIIICIFLGRFLRFLFLILCLLD